MNEFTKDALGFLLGCLGVALVVFALFGGIALMVAQGQSQTCARSGGVWAAHDQPFGGGSEHARECKR